MERVNGSLSNGTMFIIKCSIATFMSCAGVSSFFNGPFYDVMCNKLSICAVDEWRAHD